MNALLGPAEVRALAAELGIRPTKKLGQNFVHDPNTVRRIVRAAFDEGFDQFVVAEHRRRVVTWREPGNLPRSRGAGGLGLHDGAAIAVEPHRVVEGEPADGVFQVQEVLELE